MKKLSAIIIAMALVLGLGQCKKQETPNTTDPEDGIVYITVKAGHDGARHTVYPNHGLYAFDDNDKLYVGHGGHYIGTLTYNDGAFGGSIQPSSADDYLHFYFLGGKGPDAPSVGDESFTISIADQSGELPILSYGHSTQKYTAANSSYSAKLRNKCALVEFATNEIPMATEVSISGMQTEATINFNDTDNAIVANGTTSNIKLHTESATSRWAILLPSEAVTTTATAQYYDEPDSFTVPAVAINSFLHGTSAVSFEMTLAGAINSKFSVSANQQVYFSQGNLQYQASTNTWRFAEHQNDFVGDASSGNVYEGEDKCNNRLISSSYSGWIDLFGWAMSGYGHNAMYFAYPWTTSQFFSSNYYYAYGDYRCDLCDGDGKADWGYNAISNGNNTENSGWRTLSKDEWTYLFYSRTDAASKYGYGSVGGETGLIILPDEWTLPEGLSFTSDDTYSWPNGYTTEQWALMEANGAVFLPTAGLRNGTNTSGMSGDSSGNYWTSTHYDDEYAYDVDFLSCALYLQNDDQNHCGRHYGLSVRLVRNAE